jgi:hypothetical protein
VTTINLPDPVFEVYVESSWLGNYTSEEFAAEIRVGDVVVFSRVYSSDPEDAECEYAHAENDAREKVLKAFGEKLKAVLS